MDRLQRIYRLHQIISSHHLPVSLRTLQEKAECSRATINRIIQELRDYFNAPLQYDRERNVQPGNFQTLAGGLLQRKRLAISYHGRGNDQTSRREISPQRLTHYRDKTAYAFLRCRLMRRTPRYAEATIGIWMHGAIRRKALRSFAVERISNATVLNGPCHDVAEKQLDAHFASAYGIFAGQAQQQAVLRFTPERARWVADEQWHPGQQGKFLEDGRYELQIPYSDSRELVMDILKHGAEVEVVSPNALRQEVMQQLKVALARYLNQKIQ